MKRTVKATNCTLTPDVSRYLEKKCVALQKFLSPYGEAVTVDVEIGRTTRHHQHGDVFRAEFNVHLPGQSLRATAETTDLFAAIDEAKEEIVRELGKSKEKRVTMMRRAGGRLKEFVRRFWRWSR